MFKLIFVSKMTRKKKKKFLCEKKRNFESVKNKIKHYLELRKKKKSYRQCELLIIGRYIISKTDTLLRYPSLLE